MKDDERRTHRDDQRPPSDNDEDQEDAAGEDGGPETESPDPSSQAQREQDRQLESGEENPA